MDRKSNEQKMNEEFDFQRKQNEYNHYKGILNRFKNLRLSRKVKMTKTSRPENFSH